MTTPTNPAPCKCGRTDWHVRNLVCDFGPTNPAPPCPYGEDADCAFHSHPAPESAGGETRKRDIARTIASAIAGLLHNDEDCDPRHDCVHWPKHDAEILIFETLDAYDESASTPAAPQPETDSDDLNCFTTSCVNCGDDPRHRLSNEAIKWTPSGDALCPDCQDSRGVHAVGACACTAPQPETEGMTCPNADVSSEPWIAHTTCSLCACSLCAPSRSLDDLLTDMAMWPWQPGRWFRVVTPAGELWAETSDPEEAQRIADKTGWRLERQWFCQPAEWRVVREAAADCHRDPLDDFEEPTPCSRCGTVVERQEMMCCYDCRMKSGICEDCMDEHNADEHAGNGEGDDENE